MKNALATAPAVRPAGATPQFGARSFERVRRLIHEIAGISLSDGKRTMVQNRLTKRLRATGHDGFDAYLDLVESTDAPERVYFANALTTNLTSFFREAHHFPILVEHLRGRPPRAASIVWSAACSTGEEPYSIAMSIVEALGEEARDVRIVASDLDTEALETARAGIYPIDRAAALGEERLRRFFLRGEGARAGFFKVRPEIARMVEFRHINLCDASWPIEPSLAAIFCRNAMIYFAKPTQLAILERFAPLLGAGGLLFAGHSENFHYLAGKLLRSCGRTVYRPL